MKTTALITSILFSMVCFSQSFKGVIDSTVSKETQSVQDAYHEKSKWNDNLAEYLIKNNNADISVTGYQYLMPIYTNLFVYSRIEEKWSKQDIVDDINQMVKLNQLSPLGLSIALDICQEYFEITSNKCDMELIISKQIELEPKNAYVYLYPIKKAVENKDSKEIEYLLKQIAQSKYLEIFNYTHKKLDPIIDDFIQTHPFGKAFIKYRKDQLIIETEVSEEKKHTMLDNLEEYILLEEKINFQLAVQMPPFKVLLDLCKNKNKYQKECLSISNLFIPNKNIIPAMIGHVIKTETLKQYDPEKHPAAEAAYQKYRNEFDCLSKINQQSDFWQHINFEIYEIVSNEQREKGTLAFLMKQTEIYYQRELKNGSSNLQDPKKCFGE